MPTRRASTSPTPQPLSDDEIRRVEQLVNAEILANAAAEARVMAIDEAQKTGAMMLFGEKYGDEVRVLDIGSSRELCGGTHVARTGDIGLFKIVTEGGVAAGVRRIEAVTGDNALSYVQLQLAQLDDVAAQVKAPTEEAAARVAQIVDSVKALEKELARLKSKLAASQGDDLLSAAIDVKGIKVLAAQLDGADAKALARDAGQAQGQTEERRHRARQRRRRQGEPDRRRYRRPHGESESRRAGERRRTAGRRQGRRPAGHGAGRRHPAGTSAAAGFGQGLGRAQTLIVGRSVCCL